MVELRLSTEFEEWLARQIVEREEPMETLVRDIGVAVTHVQDAIVGMYEWGNRHLAPWQRQMELM